MDNPTNAQDHSTIASSGTGLPLVMMGRYQASEGEHFAPHRHVGHELIVWRSGNILCEIGQGEDRLVIRTYPGMVTLVPGGVIHADTATTAYDHVYALFGTDLPLPGLDRPQVFHDTANSDLERLLLTLEQEFNGHAAYRTEMVDLLCRQLVIRLLRLEQEQDVSSAELLVRRAERLLAERHADNPDLQALAAELGVSSATLRAKFMQLRGCSPKAYLTRVRVKHALGHIRHSSHSLDVVASLSGYSSSGHLWRDVKQVTGRPPGAFRHGTFEETEEALSVVVGPDTADRSKPTAVRFLKI